jgi:hypothetical protein
MYNHALSSERFILHAVVVELVYTTDLKSVDLWLCGFKSRPRHHLGDNLVHPVAKSSYQTNLVVSLL